MPGITIGTSRLNVIVFAMSRPNFEDSMVGEYIQQIDTLRNLNTPYSDHPLERENEMAEPTIITKSGIEVPMSDIKEIQRAETKRNVVNGLAVIGLGTLVVLANGILRNKSLPTINLNK